MDIIESIRRRRSVRLFEEKPVPLETLKELIRFGVMAPSATNRQGWYFIIVTDPDLRRMFVEKGGSRVILNAPAGLLAVYSTLTWNAFYHDEVQSAAAAIENILLMVEVYGLGACWTCQLPPPHELARRLGIPRGYRAMAYIALGYPKKVPPHPREQKPVETMMGINRCDLNPVPRKMILRCFFKKQLVRGYYWLPACFRKYLEAFVHRHYVTKFT
jgi:nitroreductase